MTVIAWDGRTLAADRMMNFGGLHGTSRKLYRLTDGSLCGGCGEAGELRELRAWLDAGADPATFPKERRAASETSPMLVVRPDGTLLLYERTAYPSELHNRFFAIGSGRDFAMMAMRLGRPAAEAVQLTSELCNDCGNGVDAMELPR